jgi:energy-converting hydrogenase B subunit D
MLILQFLILTLVAIVGTAVVLTRDPRNQVIGLSFFGLILAAMFFIYQAPDVALSQIVIGAVALPLMFMLTMAKVRRNTEEQEARKRREQQKGKEVA